MFASLATGLLLKFQFATSATLRQLPQTPTLIGCKFLMITRDSHLPNSAAISEALYYNTLLDDVKEIFPESSDPHLLATTWEQHAAPDKPCIIARFFDRSSTNCDALGLDRSKKRSQRGSAFLAASSLTMTYFHTGIRTIIGAESFHCPVRDGKEWFQLAMVIRL